MFNEPVSKVFSVFYPAENREETVTRQTAAELYHAMTVNERRTIGGHTVFVGTLNNAPIRMRLAYGTYEFHLENLPNV